MNQNKNVIVLHMNPYVWKYDILNNKYINYQLSIINRPVFHTERASNHIVVNTTAPTTTASYDNFAEPSRP